MLVYGVIVGALSLVTGLVSAAILGPTEVNSVTGEIDGPNPFLQLLVQLVSSLVTSIPGLILGLCFIRGVLDVAEGRPFELGQLFTRIPWGSGIITSILVSLMTTVGMLLCVLPGIAVAVFAYFSLYFVIDRQLSPVDAIKASFGLVRDNLGNTILWVLVAFVMMVVGACLCGVGLLVAMPLMYLGSAYTYKKLTQQPVAA